MFKSATSNPIFDIAFNPVPPTLKSGLDLLNQSFSNTHMRNLDMVYNSNGETLYGLMTNYEGKNFCWIQPTRVKAIKADEAYDKYIRRLNNGAEKMVPLEVKIGSDCIARYEVDKHWYRGIVVEHEADNKWVVLFIDYGNFQTCDLTHLSAPIIESQHNHYYVPVQSLCCRLYNIVPTDPAYQDEIDKKLEHFFTKHVNTYLEIKVRNIRPDYVIDCDVFHVEDDGTYNHKGDRLYRKHIGQELVDSGIATFADATNAHAIKQPKPEPFWKSEFGI